MALLWSWNCECSHPRCLERKKSRLSSTQNVWVWQLLTVWANVIKKEILWRLTQTCIDNTKTGSFVTVTRKTEGPKSYLILCFTMQLDNFTLQDIGNQTANDCDQMYFSQETLRIGHGLLGFKYKIWRSYVHWLYGIHMLITKDKIKHALVLKCYTYRCIILQCYIKIFSLKRKL